MRESKIESYFRKQVIRVGGWAVKFTPIGYAGFPDRIALLPGGRIVFVELKAPGKKPGKLQNVVHRRLRKLGFKVCVIDNIESVNKFIKDYE